MQLLSFFFVHTVINLVGLYTYLYLYYYLLSVLVHSYSAYILLLIIVIIGPIAICPVDPNPKTSPGRTVSLRVYVAGFHDIPSNEITWNSPSGLVITSGSKYTLLDDNRHLLIRDVQSMDRGTYRIDLQSLDESSSYRGLIVTSTILLDLEGKVLFITY